MRSIDHELLQRFCQRLLHGTNAKHAQLVALPSRQQNNFNASCSSGREFVRRDFALN
jgi:hypothetical protein